METKWGSVNSTEHAVEFYKRLFAIAFGISVLNLLLAWALGMVGLVASVVLSVIGSFLLSVLLFNEVVKIVTEQIEQYHNIEHKSEQNHTTEVESSAQE